VYAGLTKTENVLVQNQKEQALQTGVSSAFQASNLIIMDVAMDHVGPLMRQGVRL